jgi:uncharacterized protein DUF6152
MVSYDFLGKGKILVMQRLVGMNWVGRARYSLLVRCLMKGNATIFFAVICGLLAISLPTFAHHGNSAYDMSKTVPMKATITKFEYSNPHTQVYYDVTDDKGNVEHWVAETTNPAMLNRVGWSRETLKPGDQVTLFVNPNKVGAKVTFLQKVVFSDGKELTTQKGF